LHHAIPVDNRFGNDYQLKNWRIETREPERILFHCSRPFGEEWIEQRVEPIPPSLRDGVLPSKQST
jgi:hypothetical protein